MLLPISTRHQCAYDVYTIMYIFIHYTIYVSIKDLARFEKNDVPKFIKIQDVQGGIMLPVCWAEELPPLCFRHQQK